MALMWLRRGAAAAADDVDRARPAPTHSAVPPYASASRHIRPSRWAARHWDRALTSVSATWEISSTEGRSCSAPKEQLSPTENGRRCFSEYQNASGVWPEDCRPDRSVMVSDSMMRQTRRPSHRTSCSTAKPAALAFSVSKMVSIRIGIDAAFDQPARLRRIGIDQRIEAHVAEARVVHVRRERRRAVGGADGAGDESAACPAFSWSMRRRRHARASAAATFRLMSDRPRVHSRSARWPGR